MKISGWFRKPALLHPLIETFHFPFNWITLTAFLLAAAKVTGGFQLEAKHICTDGFT